MKKEISHGKYLRVLNMPDTEVKIVVDSNPVLSGNSISAETCCRIILVDKEYMYYQGFVTDYNYYDGKKSVRCVYIRSDKIHSHHHNSI